MLQQQTLKSYKLLEQYLLHNNMHDTLSMLRIQVMSKLPIMPSTQFYQVLSEELSSVVLTNTTNNNHTIKTVIINDHSSSNKYKSKNQWGSEGSDGQLTVEGLLGKIAYSDKILDDQKLNSKVYQMMGHQYFEKALNKMFPKSTNKMKNKNNKIDNQHLPGQLSLDFTFNTKQSQQKVKTNQTINQYQQNLHKKQSQQVIIKNQAQIVQQFNDYIQCNLDSFMAKNTDRNKHQRYNEQNIVKKQLLQSQQSEYSSQSQWKINPSSIQYQKINSLISHPSLLYQQIKNNQQNNDQYLNDEDQGYHQFIFTEKQVITGCTALANKHGYPSKALKQGSKINLNNQYKRKSNRKNEKFKNKIIFPKTADQFYPVEYNQSIYDTYKLKVISNREKTGLEAKRSFNFISDQIIAGQYKIISVLGNGVFAKAYKAVNLINNNQEVCLKMVSNNKDYFDQALDEIKILRIIHANYYSFQSVQQQCYLLKYRKSFYYREHLFIETQIHKDNLYVAYTKNPMFFSISAIKQISKQVLIGLHNLHKLSIVHGDLKPQNILIKSYDPLIVQIVDFGNSFFIHDKQVEYIQSRSYRSPEVILGIQYDYKIDIWSIGCILAQLWTKNVIFANVSTAGMLAKIQGIVGPWPQWMLEDGIFVQEYFSKENIIFYEENSQYHILIPKETSLKARVRTDNEQFLEFLEKLLEIDPNLRYSADEALIISFVYED